MRETRIDESGHITVKNLSAYWIPEISVERDTKLPLKQDSPCGLICAILRCRP